MAQFVKPQLAAPDYDSTIIGALELSEKKWVLTVQVPGVERHSRHVVESRRRTHCSYRAIKGPLR